MFNAFSHKISHHEKIFSHDCYLVFKSISGGLDIKIIKGFVLNLTKWEVSDKNDESDEGGSDFGGWTLQDVLAESGGVLKENLVTKPRPDFLWRLHVGGEKLVPLWGGAPQVLFGVEAGGEEELGR